MSAPMSVTDPHTGTNPVIDRGEKGRVAMYGRVFVRVPRYVHNEVMNEMESAVRRANLRFAADAGRSNPSTAACNAVSERAALGAGWSHGG